MQEDPLDTLLFHDEIHDDVGQAERDSDAHVAAVRRDLDALTKALEAPEPRAGRFAGMSLSKFNHPVRVPDDVRAGLEGAARRLWNTKFEGKGHLESGLMRHVAFSAMVGSVPFFLDAVDFTRPRDTLIPARQREAVAGIAFLEAKTGAPEAAQALDGLLAHREGRVRAFAVSAIGRVRRTPEGDLEGQAIARLGRVAAEDPAFEPRWLARVTLIEAGVRVPCEPCDGSYVFKVCYGGRGRVSRTLELRSDQALDDLAWGIVDAIGWDHDHLFRFQLGKESGDWRMRWPADEEPDRMEPPEIGSVGLLPRHRFEMLYDFGDHNLFGIEVVDVRDKRDANASYPRTVASSGAAPRQYAQG